MRFAKPLSLLALLFAAPVFAGEPPAYLPPFDPPVALVARTGDSAPHPAIVRVRREVSAVMADCGSGTVIASESGTSLILTCAHVVPDGTRPVTVTTGGKVHPAKFLDAGGAYPDLAILEVAADLPVALIADRVPLVGARLRQWGFCEVGPNGEPKYKTGTVTDPRAADGLIYVDPHLTATLPAKEGDSGSGLFNDSGELCGVTCRRTNHPQALAVAMPVTTVRVFVRKHTVRFPRLHALLHGKPTLVPRNEPPAAQLSAKPPCVCGPACPCPAGACPNKCPLVNRLTLPGAKAAPAAPRSPSRLTINGVPHELRSDGRYWPVTDSCPNGRCPLR